jgi:hypothetical protein
MHRQLHRKCFSKTHQQRLDAGIIIGWDVWKVVDNPQENFTHMLTQFMM